MPNVESSGSEQATASAALPEAGTSDTLKPDRPRRSELRSERANTTMSLATAAKPGSKKKAAETKSAIVLKKLCSAKGATIKQLMQATGWQAHSVRGFLSATVKKKLQLSLTNEAGKDGIRRYKIEDAASAS